jgi:hypothetical protein
VQVVQGDVSSLAEVQNAVSTSKTPIKGVIQAMLSLEVRFHFHFHEAVSNLIITHLGRFLTLHDPGKFQQDHEA